MGYVSRSRGHGLCRRFGVEIPIDPVGSNPKQWHGRMCNMLGQTPSAVEKWKRGGSVGELTWRPQ